MAGAPQVGRDRRKLFVALSSFGWPLLFASFGFRAIELDSLAFTLCSVAVAGCGAMFLIGAGAWCIVRSSPEPMLQAQNR